MSGSEDRSGLRSLGEFAVAVAENCCKEVVGRVWSSKEGEEQQAIHLLK